MKHARRERLQLRACTVVLVERVALHVREERGEPVERLARNGSAERVDALVHVAARGDVLGERAAPNEGSHERDLPEIHVLELVEQDRVEPALDAAANGLVLLEELLREDDQVSVVEMAPGAELELVGTVDAREVTEELEPRARGR